MKHFHSIMCVELEGGAWTNDDVMVYKRVGACGFVCGEIFILSDLYSPSLFYTSREESLLLMTDLLGKMRKFRHGCFSFPNY